MASQGAGIDVGSLLIGKVSGCLEGGFGLWLWVVVGDAVGSAEHDWLWRVGERSLSEG